MHGVYLICNENRVSAENNYEEQAVCQKETTRPKPFKKLVAKMDKFIVVSFLIKDFGSFKTFNTSGIGTLDDRETFIYS